MGDIFREVDEELKQERYERLWRQYGKYLVGGVVIVVAAVAGWQGWNSWQLSQREAEGLQYNAAVELVRTGDARAAEAAFAALGGEAGGGYRTLSRFRQASLRAEAGDPAGAIDLYESLAADRDTPESLRGLATVLAGLQALGVSGISAATIESKLAPLTAAGSAYRHIAQEVLALAAERAGDRARAVSYYEKLVDDAETPPGIRARAAQMLNVLRVP